MPRPFPAPTFRPGLLFVHTQTSARFRRPISVYRDSPNILLCLTKYFLPYIHMMPFFLGNVSMSTESAYMTSKGQVVIPARLRRKYGLKEGTRLNFSEEEGRFVVQPVTKEFINSFCGIFKLKPGEKSAVQELLEDRAAERAREDREIAEDRRK